MIRRLSTGLLLCLAGAVTAAEPTTRQMNLLGWQEFAELVPGEIETAFVPVGTLEPHGVIPGGAGNIAPEAMARVLAPRLDALVVPTLNYGLTGDLDAFPGAFSIDADAYEAFVESLLTGLAGSGFLDIVIVNGGPQTRILQRVAERVGRTRRVRTLVTNWWSIASDATFEVFGENGGHAGDNETACVQAIVPEHVHPERYDDAMARPGSVPAGWSAHPFPSSIVLHEAGQGYPDFDADEARRCFDAVNDRMEALIADAIARWDAAGIFRED